jgi:hypothetical protein
VTFTTGYGLSKSWPPERLPEDRDD